MFEKGSRERHAAALIAAILFSPLAVVMFLLIVPVLFVVELFHKRTHECHAPGCLRCAARRGRERHTLAGM